MATSKNPPGRTLAFFFLGVAVIFGLVAIAPGGWTPSLGLDLQGGTRITLAAEGDPSEENLEEARRIIDQRVNGSGIVEAEVIRQGSEYIVVEVPGSGDDRSELEETVRRTAQLRFRLVACTDRGDASLCADGSDLGMTPGGGLGRAAPAFGPAEEEPTDATSEETTEEGSEDATPEPTEESTELGPNDPWNPDAERTVDDELAWMNAPDARSVELYNSHQCVVEQDAEGEPIPVLKQIGEEGELLDADIDDDPNAPLVACELLEDATPDGQPGAFKFLLSRSVIEGTELDDASAGVPQNQAEWVVSIEMGNDSERANPPGSQGAAKDFEEISRALVGTERLFAIVLDGEVLSAPTMQAVITNGNSQISGDFNEVTATNLATSLKYGALPIDFPEEEISVLEVGPSLAGDQLSTGLFAGGLGLLLVMLYCLVYYRGLGAVVLASLAIGAAITYGMVLLLSETAGFTLTLPGLAGFIIAVGVVGDSFIIYFERIRDEMREGKSPRVAVETGWVRARKTRIAANTVSLLSALMLYIFATGSVKGFGFALGLSTLIDLAVLFWFTKPMVTWLVRFRFFNSGHRFSGLSDTTLGVDRPAMAGGNA